MFIIDRSVGICHTKNKEINVLIIKLLDKQNFYIYTLKVKLIYIQNKSGEFI